jgi:FdhD protein
MALKGPWRSPLDPQRVTAMQVTHWQGRQRQPREDLLTVEEPLEIRVNGRSLAAIMRTPGHDRELAAGFLFTEGIISGLDDLLSLEEAVDADGLPLANVIDVVPHPGGSSLDGGPQQRLNAAFERHFAVSASCGFCGKNSIADLLCSISPLDLHELRISASTLYQLSDELLQHQAVFTHTGGLHAAGLFDTGGQLLLLREDVGRHNAVDKLIGHGLLHGVLPYSRHILLVSGRTSFEILQKALLARIPCVAAISAPSSLAVDLANESGITLIGFLRGQAMNVYTHPERII